MTKEDPLCNGVDSSTMKKTKADDLEAPSPKSSLPPSYQKVDRGSNTNKDQDDGDDGGNKSCRICLEDDYPEDMIAPCQCNGGSKWVHRRCLDQWRIHESDRAFSKCTECLFQYHLQPVPVSRVRQLFPRRAKYIFLVSRDVCLATLTLQGVVVFFGWMVSWMDSERSLPANINPDYPVVVYYLFGFLALLVLLGIFGCMMLCFNGCSVEGSLQQFPAVERARGGAPGEETVVAEVQYQPTYRERSGAYHMRRQQSQRRRNNRANFCDNCCLGCYYNPSPYYYGDPGPCFYCCCCCDGDSSGAAGAAARGGSVPGADCCSCDCCPDGRGAGNSDCGEACLAFLVVAAIFMAILGFLVGIIIVVVVFQRTVQRHIHVLHKRQLANEFQVMDLAEYNLEQPLVLVPETTNTSTTGGGEADVESPAHPLPSAPPLEEMDSTYLKNCGLME
jgi:hypothetical protein